MHKINRNTFLAHSLKAGALVVLSPLSNPLFADVMPGNAPNQVAKDDILRRLVLANDRQVARLLPLINAGIPEAERMVGYYFAVLSAAYCSPGSEYYQGMPLIAPLEKLAKLLLDFQAEDGTLNLGVGNLESPPDTAFLLDPLAAGVYLLEKQASAGLTPVKSDIKKFLLRAGEAMVTGGVHTPNHRWVVCAALARLNAVYPSKKYTDRIEDWLGEGVFIDKDGHFPERSINYALVEVEALTIVGRLLNKPALFEPVRKNLDLTWYYMDPDGSFTATDSRRQDQYSFKRTILQYYLYYRYMAIRDNNSRYAGIATLIEQVKGFDEEILGRALFHFLENPLLQESLPAGTPPPTDYEKLFTSSQLLRIRRGRNTTTLFGGVDWPLIIASGRSANPNIFSYRKGNAVLKYLRISSGFFNTGYFYSDGIRKDGSKYVLHKKLDVPYYQPLPQRLRKKDGDYKLSPSIDGRFWNKMDYSNRTVSNVKTLETTVVFAESNGENELTIQVSGQAGVPVTIELCFAAGGTLSGVTPAGDGNSFLEKGTGQYESGGDTIRFGPGTLAHKSITGLEGERYSTHFGSLRTEGMHVYLTGMTPFEHKLVFG